MCGILGYMGYRPPTDEEFKRALSKLVSRGPDGESLYRKVIRDEMVYLGHRRLAIIDTDTRSAQPMASECGRYVVVYNGEIYNYRELRSQLITRGHSFRTQSDTEVLLEGFRAFGESFWDQLNGIFAFAILDQESGDLRLVRDRLGVKPLYYADLSQGLYFASDIAALLEFGDLPVEPDYLGIDSFLSFGYVPQPATGFKAIRQISPGYQFFHAVGRGKMTQWWTLPLGAKKHIGTDAELIDEFGARLGEAVKRQLTSDVPVGAFLSSGTDSFAIVKAMCEQGGAPERVYSIGFEDPAFNELPETRLAAEALGVPLDASIFSFDGNDFLSPLPCLLDPFADSSSLAVYQLCQHASKKHKVVLSGDGADEMLAGYGTYDASKYAQIYRAVPSLIRRGFIEPLAKCLPDIGGRYTLGDKARRFVHGASMGRWLDHASWRVIVSEEDKQGLYTPHMQTETKGRSPFADYAAKMELAEAAGHEPLDCMLYADLTYYLPSDMLMKVDKMSMAHGLEVRVPFLDHDLVEWCWSLPVHLKRYHGIGKVVLREIIRDSYPEQLARMPKKGFNVCVPSLRAPVGRLQHILQSKKIKDFSGWGEYHRFLVNFSLTVLDQWAHRVR